MKYLKTMVAQMMLLFITLVSVIPFVYMLLMSLKSTTNKYDLDFSIEKLSLNHYFYIFTTDIFLQAFFNSVLIAILGVVLTLIVCTLAGYAFARFSFRGNDKCFIAMIATMVVPSEVIIIPLYLIVKELGGLNTYWALILPLPTAFGVFIMRQAILGVSSELVDAARIDGCKELQLITKVVLPLVKSSIMALAIFTFIGAWNNFLWPLIISSKAEMRTLPLALATMKTQWGTADVGLTMACAAVNFLPPFLFYCFLQSKFKEGIMLSGIKG